MKKRPPANLSLDLDNQWAYVKTQGEDGWQDFPSYLDTVAPRYNRILRELDLNMTVFVVGKDASLEKNHAALRALADAGHEIANHSFFHEPWLHLYSREEITKELADTEDAIKAATGVHPTGFRGPGFSRSATLLEVLAERGYRYDSSVFPTFLGPLARAYFFLKSDLPEEEKQKRRKLYGKCTDGLASLNPFRWKTASRELLEIPVTTLPFLKLPIHASYLVYLYSFSPLAAKAYFRLALTLCRLTGVRPTFLLHPPDILGHDDTDALSFFPGMTLDADTKVALMRWMLLELKKRFDVLPMGKFAMLAEPTITEGSPQPLPATPASP